jgi:hypothetical protein
MDGREIYKEKIEKQLSKWKTTIEGLKTKVEQAEVNAKAKLHKQLEGWVIGRLKTTSSLATCVPQA